MKLSHLGKSSGKRGKHLSKRTKEELRRINLGKHLSQETKRKISKTLKGRPNLKNAKFMKKRWQNPVYREEQLELILKGLHIKPNKPEKLLNKLLQRLFPNQYKYVGDGQFILAGKCPDFVNINGQKKIIELFGNYWHRPEEEQDRIDLFFQYGYQTLVVWEDELEDVNKLKQKLLDFC